MMHAYGSHVDGTEVIKRSVTVCVPFLYLWMGSFFSWSLRKRLLRALCRSWTNLVIYEQQTKVNMWRILQNEHTKGNLSRNRDVFIYHEHDDEDEADSDDDEKGDQVVFQREAEVWHEDHMTPRKKNSTVTVKGLQPWDTQSKSPGWLAAETLHYFLSSSDITSHVLCPDILQCLQGFGFLLRWSKRMEPGVWTYPLSYV